MLRTAVTAARAVPKTMATGKTARRYSTRTLSAGTWGSNSAITPVITAIRATLTSSPRAQRPTNGLVKRPAIAPAPARTLTDRVADDDPAIIPAQAMTSPRRQDLQPRRKRAAAGASRSPTRPNAQVDRRSARRRPWPPDTVRVGVRSGCRGQGLAVGLQQRRDAGHIHDRVQPKARE
jgi:hypothetical protein